VNVLPADPPPPEPSHRVSGWRAFVRALRGLCPARGLSKVFVHRFRSERRCDACGWVFERCEGHWVGGSEINMIVTFWTACPLFIAISLTFGLGWITLVFAGAFTVAFSLAIHRPSRCLFIALDHLVDPRLDPSEGGGDRRSAPLDPPDRPDLPLRLARTPDDGSRASRSPS